MKLTAWRTLDGGGQFVLLGSAPDPKVQVTLTVPDLQLSAKMVHMQRHFAGSRKR